MAVECFRRGDFPSIFYRFSIDFPWFSTDFRGFSSDFLRFSNGFRVVFTRKRLRLTGAKAPEPAAPASPRVLRLKVSSSSDDDKEPKEPAARQKEPDIAWKSHEIALKIP